MPRYKDELGKRLIHGLSCFRQHTKSDTHHDYFSLHRHADGNFRFVSPRLLGYVMAKNKPHFRSALSKEMEENMITSIRLVFCEVISTELQKLPYPTIPLDMFRGLSSRSTP